MKYTHDPANELLCWFTSIGDVVHKQGVQQAKDALFVNPRIGRCSYSGITAGLA